MFEDTFWRITYPLALSLLVWAAIVSPLVSFVWGGQKRRIQELHAAFTIDGMRSYLQTLHNKREDELKEDGDVVRFFKEECEALVGPRAQRFTLYLLAALLFIAVSWVVFTAYRTLLPKPVDPLTFVPLLPNVALASICGALLRITLENVRCSSAHKFSRISFTRALGRISFSVPLGYVIASPFDDALAPVIALLVGWFPLSTVESWGRRFVEDRVAKAQGIKYEDSTSSLPSVDEHVAEELSGIGVNTIFELAYQDPVQVSARTGLDVIAVTEHMNQALLARYLGKDISKLRPYGLVGAQEVYNLWHALNPSNPSDEAQADAKAQADKVLAAAAKALGMETSDALRNTFGEVAGDPYTMFLASYWVDTAERIAADQTAQTQIAPTQQDLDNAA